MNRRLYQFYESVKQILPWRVKAAAKGFFLDLFFYRRAERWSKNQSFLPSREAERNRKLRVLFVTPHLVFGGAEQIMFDVIKGLSASGIENAVACAVKTGEWVKKFEGITDVYDLSCSKGLWEQKDALVSLANKIDCSIVQFSNCEILYFALPYLKAKTNAATANWVHIDQSYFNLLHAFGYKRFSPFIDKTIVTTEAMRNYLIKEKYCPPEKISAIRNGVDLEAFNPSRFMGRTDSLKDKFGVPRENLAVIFMSRLVREKNPAAFLKIVSLVEKTNPKTSFIVVGGGYLRNTMIRQARELGIAKNMIFLGFRDEVQEILSIASVFVSTSLTEGFGLSAAEAMAMNVPIVISETGAYAELIAGGGGFAVNGGGPAAYANKISRLLRDGNLRKEMGTKARQSAKAEFSSRLTISAMINVYSELARQ